MPEICDMAHFDEELMACCLLGNLDMSGKKSQKFNHGNKQIKERDHVTNENGACQI